MKTATLGWFTVAAAMLAASCARDCGVPHGGAAARHADAATGPVTLDHITHFSPTVISGSEPTTDADFEAIRAMGARTIVSVDGATPNVELAHAHGLRYVHIPIAYSAMNASDEAQLERAAREIDGVMFVHCHHGLHRGPVGAGVIYASQANCSGADAARIIQDAGLPRKYVALHESLEAFHPNTRKLPDPKVVGPLPEIARRDSLTMTMSDIDRSWERLTDCRKSEWRSPEDHPDVVPAHEAAIFAELFREANRLHMADADDDLRARMTDAEQLAWALSTALEAGDPTAASVAADRINASCNDCHGLHRNN